MAQMYDPLCAGTNLSGAASEVRTVIQDNLKIEENYSAASRAQERVSERANKRVSADKRATERSSAQQANE